MPGDPRLQSRKVPEVDCMDDVQSAFAILEGRWKMAIVAQLYGHEVMRFSDLRRAIPAVSQKMLIQQLRGLEADGVIERTVHAQIPPRVDYALSTFGRELGPVFLALMDWVRGREATADGRTSISHTASSATGLKPSES